MNILIQEKTGTLHRVQKANNKLGKALQYIRQGLMSSLQKTLKHFKERDQKKSD